MDFLAKQKEEERIKMLCRFGCFEHKTLLNGLALKIKLRAGFTKEAISTISTGIMYHDFEQIASKALSLVSYLGRCPL